VPVHKALALRIVHVTHILYNYIQCRVYVTHSPLCPYQGRRLALQIRGMSSSILMPRMRQVQIRRVSTPCQHSQRQCPYRGQSDLIKGRAVRNMAGVLVSIHKYSVLIEDRVSLSRTDQSNIWQVSLSAFKNTVSFNIEDRVTLSRTDKSEIRRVSLSTFTNYRGQKVTNMVSLSALKNTVTLSRTH
jgi:hypothetical protein